MGFLLLFLFSVSLCKIKGLKSIAHYHCLLLVTLHSLSSTSFSLAASSHKCAKTSTVRFQMTTSLENCVILTPFLLDFISAWFDTVDDFILSEILSFGDSRSPLPH